MESPTPPPTPKFDEIRLLKFLDDIQQNILVKRRLSVIARMKIPEDIAKNCGVLEKIERFENDPELGSLVAIIRRKHQKMINGNATRRVKFAKKSEIKTITGATETFHDINIPAEFNPFPYYPVWPDTNLYNGFPSFPQQIGLPLNPYASPLQIEIPQQKRDKKFNSNDLLAQRFDPIPLFQPIGQLLALNTLNTNFEMTQPTSETPLNFGPGLQQSETSAFRPFVSRPRITIADIYNSPHFQEIYRKVVQEDEALRAVINPTVDQVLDEMSMMNAPFFMFHERRQQQQQQRQGTSNN